MNLRILSRLIGSLLFFPLASLGICLVCAFFFLKTSETEASAFTAFLKSFLICLIFALILVLVGGKVRKNEVLRRESVAVVGLGWIFCIICGAFPYLFCDTGMSLSECLFESVSGFTTTGATVIDDLDRLPDSLLLWRSMTQWLGGMGILILLVAILSQLGASSISIFRNESSAFETEGLSSRIQQLAFHLLVVYLTFTAACFLVLWLVCGMGWYDAICHTFTTVATGGFSPHDRSVAHFDSVLVEVCIMGFMLLSSFNYLLYVWLFRKGDWWTRWRSDESMRYFLLIWFSFALIVTGYLTLFSEDTAWQTIMRQAFFQVTALVTTTGYTTADYDQWPSFAIILLLALMMVGGCAGSTSGGLKVGRLILFFKILFHQLRLSFRPNRVMQIKLNGHVVSQSFQSNTLLLLTIAGVSVLGGTAIVCLLEPEMTIRTCFSATVSTLFNIGPALGEVGPAKTYASLEDATKYFLSVLMVMGRLEFTAFLVLMIPGLWRSY